MTQSKGFVHLDLPHHVCKLNKSLYGLKQAPHAWFHKFNSHLQSLGFTCSQPDPFIFVFCTATALIILLLNVDGIIIRGSPSTIVDDIIRYCSRSFE